MNMEVQKRLGGVASARCLLWSFDFAQIEALQMVGEWDLAAGMMVSAALALESAGAELILICSNTMHRCAPEVESAVGIPLLHIVDPTGYAIQDAGLKRVGLLGTAFTMEQAFYKQRLATQFELDVIIPEARHRSQIHAIIFEELVRGVIKPASRLVLEAIADALMARGAQGIILGCTELMLLMSPREGDVPIFDTTALHAAAAVAHALSPLMEVQGRLC
jgi:aspartate racemase